MRFVGRNDDLFALLTTELNNPSPPLFGPWCVSLWGFVLIPNAVLSCCVGYWYKTRLVKDDDVFLFFLLAIFSPVS